MRLSVKLVSILLLSAAPALADDLSNGLPKPVFLDEVTFPTALSIDGVQVGGLSDLSYDASAGNFLAISDDRAEFGPVRFYRIGMTVQKNRIAKLDIGQMKELMAPGGRHFGLKGADPEGIALDSANQRIFWTSERDEKSRPSLYVSDLDGTNTKSIELPEAFAVNAEKTHGVIENLGFEGLDLGPDGSTLYALDENALAQDGGKATLDKGSASRLLVLDTKTLTPKAQYVYLTDKIPAAPVKAGGWADNGASALMALKDGRFVVIERNFTEGHGFNIRFYLVDPAGATDVNGRDAISIDDVKPMAKSLWFSLVDGDDGLKIDNIESIAFGPVVDGRQTMLLASDNNFSPEQATKFTLFAVDMPATH
ncbi:esterase-like activity of phytase family protein [Neorhizobium sp. NCHU2750]|uniref:esterase-like activity of phytase family protein n=1 Tax=Neorhizobium sp. NCHU2750 TaxID=1825976 RepID=UPI000E769725|nr:hypothetical protein NCHU2750_22400 [Neorhizobium sp. NCHU2750]